MGYLRDIFDRHWIEIERRERNIVYANDPAAWAKDRLGIDLWYKQVEVCLSILKNKNTAVRAGHGVGKSFLAALLSAWWIDTHPLGSAFVATTAPSADQISTVIWREIRKLHMESRVRARELEQPELALPGRITEDNKWKIDIDGQATLVASGRKPPDNKSEDAFQGIHAEFVLAIGDEACGLSLSMVDGLSNITSNETSRRLLIGNPTDPRSHFAHIFKELGNVGELDDGWHLIGISVKDGPNFHGGGVCECHPNEPFGLGMSESALRSLSDQSFVDTKAREYGEDSPRFISRVLGFFAFEMGNNLFSDYDLAQAENCHVMPDPEMPYRVLGVDIARMGTDFTFVYLAERGFIMHTDDESGEPTGELLKDGEGEYIPGVKLRHLAHWQAPFVDQHHEDGTVTRGTAERIDEIARQYGVQEVRIDASGMGHGVIDPLAATPKPYLIVEMLGGGATPDRRAYLNNRAFQYSELRRQCFQGTVDIDPKDKQLIDELGGIQYEMADAASGGGLKIESKESMKKRGVKSPDAADAAWYAVANLEHLIDDPYRDVAPGTIVQTELDDWVPSGMGGFHEYSW